MSDCFLFSRRLSPDMRYSSQVANYDGTVSSKCLLNVDDKYYNKYRRKYSFSSILRQYSIKYLTQVLECSQVYLGCFSDFISTCFALHSLVVRNRIVVDN